MQRVEVTILQINLLIDTAKRQYLSKGRYQQKRG